jgi:hypothetical protein
LYVVPAKKPVFTSVGPSLSTSQLIASLAAFPDAKSPVLITTAGSPSTFVKVNCGATSFGSSCIFIIPFVPDGGEYNLFESINHPPILPAVEVIVPLNVQLPFTTNDDPSHNKELVDDFYRSFNNENIRKSTVFSNKLSLGMKTQTKAPTEIQLMSATDGDAFCNNMLKQAFMKDILGLNEKISLSNNNLKIFFFHKVNFFFFI